MYNQRELLMCHRQLLSKESAAADLQLLEDKRPSHPRLREFVVSPAHHADAILLELLKVADSDEITKNRLRNATAPLAIPSVKKEKTIPIIAEEVKTRSPGGVPAAKVKDSFITKEEEYPLIDWQDLTNGDVQSALVIYNDRVNTHRRMKHLDEQLEKAPTEKAVQEMAELRIRNLQAFDELLAFNNTGKFLYLHPLIKNKSEVEQLRMLKRTDPEEFLRRHRRVLDNIKRYNSYLKRADRQHLRGSDRQRLSFYQDKDRTFRMIISEDNK